LFFEEMKPKVTRMAALASNEIPATTAIFVCMDLKFNSM
jgi:hypothetical protein